MFKSLIKQVVLQQGLQDPGGSYKVAHCSRDGRGVYTNCNHGRPYVDISKETVVSLEKVTRLIKGK